jgi:hypothetical protein
MKREVFVVVRRGAMVRCGKQAGGLKNPLAQGRGSENGAAVQQVLRERERSHSLWRSKPPTDKGG